DPTEPEEEEENTAPNNPGGSSTSQNQPDHSPTNAEIQSAVDALLSYIQSEQGDDGNIIDGGTSDWLTMSFAANNNNPYQIAASSSLMHFVKEYDFNGFTDLNLCAGYPRHILALLAGGVETHDESIVNLQEKIINECYADNLYGQHGINDDVFALMALLAIEQDATSGIITDITNTILEDQTDDGAFTWNGWAGADITGAAINSLLYATQHGASVESSVITNAKQYLKSEQLEDGGWGYSTSDVLTTSWAMMGINALGDTQSDWLTDDGYTPWSPLVDTVTGEGYYESAWVPGTVDWFAMKHAVPALLGASWPVVGTFAADPSENTTEQESQETAGDSNTPINGGGVQDDTLRDRATTSTEAITDRATSTDMGTSTTTEEENNATSTTFITPTAGDGSEILGTESENTDAIGGGNDDFVESGTSEATA
ncbi:MAG: hypothetical protein COV60_02045, partial [Candidatus Magasanikbacteria bacterium CG11_big_fil_rev_8_21_14_0_20_43_7]